MSIKLTITLSRHGEDEVAIAVTTNDFNPDEESEAVGCTWVGICLAINEYMHSTGNPGFDCLKQVAAPHERH